MSNKLSSLLLILLCGGCSSTSVNINTVQPPQLLASLPTLAPIQRAATVEIHNDWNGYSDPQS